MLIVRPVRYNPAPVTFPSRTERPAAPVADQVDLRLMELVSALDAGALAELYDRHSRLLFGLILRIVGQRGDAEEVLQEVFISVWNRSDTYNASLGGPVGWLVRIARNRALDRVRAN